MYFFRCILPILAMAATSLADIPTPKEGTVLASLEGLPPCYGKCFISEAHYSWPYNLSEKSLKKWCEHPMVLGGFWIRDHLMPCAERNCPHTDFIRNSADDWRAKKCP